MSRPVRALWIEIYWFYIDKEKLSVEAREGLVDWNTRTVVDMLHPVSRGPWGPCGLKYLVLIQCVKVYWSRPVRALWIEMFPLFHWYIHNMSRPVRALWIEMVQIFLLIMQVHVEAREGLVDWNIYVKSYNAAIPKSRPVRALWIEIYNVHILTLL